MKTLRDKIADIIWTATENYEMGAEPSCGSVADAIIECINQHEKEKIMEPLTKPFWVSWTAEDMAFEIHTPWWVSGEDGVGRPIICAAVMADRETSAQEYIRLCHDTPPKIIMWRFVEERPQDWTPFNDRFQKADWMRWP